MGSKSVSNTFGVSAKMPVIGVKTRSGKSSEKKSNNTISTKPEMEMLIGKRFARDEDAVASDEIQYAKHHLTELLKYSANSNLAG